MARAMRDAALFRERSQLLERLWRVVAIEPRKVLDAGRSVHLIKREDLVREAVGDNVTH